MIPKSLQNLYICSPSAPYNPAYLDKAMTRLQNLGFHITLSKHAMGNIGNTSGSIEERIEDLYEGFINPKYNLLMSSRGGWNSNELLPYIDYKLLQKYKKPFIGFSDLTTLDTALYTFAGIQTYYGSVMSWFYLDPDDADYTQMIRVLENPTSFSGFYKSEMQENDIFRHGKMKGALVGGCITILATLIGTQYAVKVPDNAILFLEDDDEPTGYLWQQHLVQMKQAGYFDHISGLLFAKPLPNTSFVKGSLFPDILHTVFDEYTFPILINGDYGHNKNPLTIPYGLEYSIEV